MNEPLKFEFPIKDGTLEIYPKGILDESKREKMIEFKNKFADIFKIQNLDASGPLNLPSKFEKLDEKKEEMKKEIKAKIYSPTFRDEFNEIIDFSSSFEVSICENNAIKSIYTLTTPQVKKLLESFYDLSKIEESDFLIKEKILKVIDSFKNESDT